MGKKVTQEKKPTYVDNMIRWSRVKRNGTRDAHYEGHRGGMCWHRQLWKAMADADYGHPLWIRHRSTIKTLLSVIFMNQWNGDNKTATKGCIRKACLLQRPLVGSHVTIANHTHPPSTCNARVVCHVRRSRTLARLFLTFLIKLLFAIIIYKMIERNTKANLGLNT